jgi:hypothetical protein
MKNEIHPIELLILAALVVAAAVIDLAKVATALVLTIAGWRTPRPAVELSGNSGQLPAAPAAPLVSPLLAELEALTVAQLQQLAGTRSKKHRKQQLITMAGLALAC